MLDARQLEAFSAVVEHGGFGPAAQALSLTLPAVSVRIKALEDGLGQRLLVRGKRVRATTAGQALLAHVKQAATEWLSLALCNQHLRMNQSQSTEMEHNPESSAMFLMPSMPSLR